MSSESSSSETVARGPGWQQRAAAVADANREPAAIPRELMAEIFAHARECYPEECCGLLMGPSSDAPLQRVVRCTNVQSQRYARGESQLDASHGFWIDPHELEGALRSAEERKEVLQGVYHSHIDTAAYPSHTDLQAAAGPNGRPLWPGVGQLVVSVRDGEVREAALFEWDANAGIYKGRRAREAD